MKDKILIPAVITTLILLIIFMLISIMEQASYSKYTWGIVKGRFMSFDKLEIGISNLSAQMAGQQALIGKIQNDINELRKTELAPLKERINLMESKLQTKPKSVK